MNTRELLSKLGLERLGVSTFQIEDMQIALNDTPTRRLRLPTFELPFPQCFGRLVCRLYAIGGLSPLYTGQLTPNGPVFFVLESVDGSFMGIELPTELNVTRLAVCTSKGRARLGCYRYAALRAWRPEWSFCK